LTIQNRFSWNEFPTPSIKWIGDAPNAGGITWLFLTPHDVDIFWPHRSPSSEKKNIENPVTNEKQSEEKSSANIVSKEWSILSVFPSAKMGLFISIQCVGTTGIRMLGALPTSADSPAGIWDSSSSDAFGSFSPVSVLRTWYPCAAVVVARFLACPSPHVPFARAPKKDHSFPCEMWISHMR